MNPQKFFRRPVGCALVFALLAVVAPSIAHAGIDLDSNGISDIWEMQYPDATDPAGDADFDGTDNRSESIFGTNPNSWSGSLALSVTLNPAGTMQTIAWPSIIGKRYQLKDSTDLNAWGDVGLPQDGNGSDLSVDVPSTGTKFYRLEVTDIDTDGDGLNDTEELAIAFNVNSAPGDTSDYDEVEAQLLLPNTVSIVPTDPFASEVGPVSGCFTITRNRTLFPYTVDYAVRTGPGTATSGIDYSPLGTSTVLAQGEATADLFVAPIADAVVESTETVTVDLAPSASPGAFDLGAPDSATVVISDPATPTGTGLLANYYDTASSTYTNSNNFRPSELKITRVDPVVDNDWGDFSPDPLIGVDTFSIRWTGQVQPQFSEDYTFTVMADNGCRLWINGVEQDLRMATSTNLSLGANSYSYDSVTGDCVVTYTNGAIPLDSIAVGDVIRLDPSSGNLIHPNGSTYTYDSVTGDAVIDYTNLTNVTPGGFAIGQTVEVDPTSGPVNLGILPYPITAATPSTFTVNFGPGLFLSGAGNINVSDNRDLTVSAATSNTFTVNFDAGKYTTGIGNMNINALNRVIKPWTSVTATNAEQYVRIPMLGGVRYDIKLEYYENTTDASCRLFWYSDSQTKQIIPQNRLYPDDGVVVQQPSTILSPVDAVALVGGGFSFSVDGSNGAVVSVSDLPPWLSYVDGVISGTPPPGSAGHYQIIITSTSAAGTGTSVLNLEVQDTGATIEREYWNGVGGTAVSDIPVGTTPSGTESLTSLEAPTDFGDNYGARIRGYITAPVTGNYHFWIAASNTAELWISNDDEPVNSLRRAYVTTGNATPQTWNGEPGQKSPWLALEEGQRYYVEILHKAGAGAGDNLAVGWSMPGEATAAPSEVVPGYALSPYVAPAAGSTPGTLYISTMLAQGAAVSNGVGSSTLQLSEDETHAFMRYSYSNLTGPITSQHIHTDPYNGKPSTIVFDIDTPANPGDGLITDPEDPNFGAYLWTITPVGTLSQADIIEIIKQGKSYINLHTAAYPSGEIRGNYTLAVGSRTFTPPPAPPAWVDDHATNNGASRFLTQATFGPNIDDITALKAMPSYEAWIDDQFTKPASLMLPEVWRTEDANAQGGALTETLAFNAWWWNSVAGDDQLRQRIAFALSEIHVVSAQGPLDNRAEALAYFYDMLATNAFGNFRDILEDTTLTWTMGRYLDMWRNDKPDPTVGRIPNENYAREIKQLFSIGLFRMWPDGSLVLTSEDQPVDTYSQREIIGFAHAFTGWDYGYDGPYRTTLNAPVDRTRQMREVPARHFTGPKRVLNNEVLPGLASVGGHPLDPYALHNSTIYNDPTYQALAAQEIDATHDQLFNHPNTGPFICRQLIQRLVTSHPSRGYLYRVVQAFDDNGSGVRGDMQAVIKAILLDYEARSSNLLSEPSFGKQREPVMRIAAAGRAFRPTGFGGTYDQNGTRTITITTDAPHGLANGNVFLDFTDTTGNPAKPAPWIGSYSATVVNANTLTVQAQGWATGSYSIPSGSTTCTVTMNNHWLQAGHQNDVDFTSGGANGTAIDQSVYQLTAASAQTGSGSGSNFTFTVPSSGTTRSGNCMIPRFSPGSYTARSSGLPYPNDRRVTMDTDYDHYLSVGDQVQLNYTGGNPLPLDAVVTVDTVDDLNTWSYLTNSDAATGFAANENNNGVYQFPLLSQPLVRNGDVGSRPSTFNMGSTEADLDQSPLNSPTVFNFFLPDFKNPGTLASQGITTPEFQTTAETTVIRQSNFLYNGLFNPNTTNGYSSFKTGNNSLVMDLSPWMPDDALTGVGLGAPNNANVPWTHNQNIARLIDHLSILLTANQLSTAAKTVVRNFVSMPIASFTVANPVVVTTSAAHGYQTGDLVCISGASTTGNFRISGVNGDYFSNTSTAYPITVTGATTFTVNGVECLTIPNSSSNDHVSQVVYNQGTTTPNVAERRDRLRSIIHLILTSPDFTIQR